MKKVCLFLLMSLLLFGSFGIVDAGHQEGGGGNPEKGCEQYKNENACNNQAACYRNDKKCKEKVVQAVCGNGVTETGETCDDGNTLTEACAYGETNCMVCNSTCQLVDGVTSYCGDGGEPDQTNGETCDAGKDNGVACTPVYGGEGCTYCDVMCQTVELSSPYCGDGGVNGTDEYPEACDYGDGNTDGPFELGYGEELTYCSTSCTEEVAKGPYCGDGEVNGEEECDGGRRCTNACTRKQPKPVDCSKFKNQRACESGQAKDLCMWVEEDDIRPVLVSDPDIQEAPLRRPDHDGYCTDKIVCGNGVVEEGEQCDDGEEGSELCDEQCNYKPTSGVQGKKFHDLDQNGKYSEGDLWLDGRMITIYTPERELVKTMTTNDDTTEAGKVAVGQYRFVNLYPGTYHVCEGASAGWIQTRPVAGFVDPNTSLYCHTVELAPGELKTGVRFGNFLVEEGDECVETATTVDALTHTTSAPLATNVMLQAGDHLVIDVASDDTWSAGEGDRTSNADGLVAGNLYGGVYGNYGDFPYGALVGQIGDGAYFLIGTSFDGVVSESGELKLMYRDSLYTDNSGEVAVQIDVNCETENECVVPEVGTVGVDQTFGSNYIVCRADEQSARVAHNDVGGNYYNALEVCQTLGYTTMTAWGGTCGTICGYCGNEGNEYYDGAGYENQNSLRYTVHRRCEGFREECVEQPDPYCGDGIVNQESEQCDNGHDLEMDFVKVAMEERYCNDECQWEEVYEPYCGNGVLDEGEACDDGNTENGDGCDNECQTEASGGGSASSVRGQTGPRTLLETGPDDDTGSEPVPATEETVIAACEEDTYILERLKKLSGQSMEIVQVIPSKYARKVGARATQLSNQLMKRMRSVNDNEARNDLIRAFVCKIEMLKEKRGLRHAHIGAESGHDELDYLLQYLQDLAILEFTK